MIKYKLTEHSISRLVGLLAGIPLNPENRDYQQFLQDVKKEGLSM